MFKQCSKCKKKLSLENFNKQNGRKDGVASQCKYCKNQREKKYRLLNLAKIRLRGRKYYKEHKNGILNYHKKHYLNNVNYYQNYYQNNKDKILEFQKKRYKVKKDNLNKQHRKYYSVNKDKLKKQMKKYRIKNRDKLNYYFKNKRLMDINFKLTCILRTRLWCALKDNYKEGSSVRDLGCSIPELKLYLEQQFKEGMTWENWGIYGWHIDHKLPLKSFDLTDRNQLLKAVHYLNLQPLWAHENLSKSDKILEEYLT